MKSYIKGGVLALCVAAIGIASAGRDGSGTYSLPAGNPVSTGTTISSTWANTTLTDIATALTNSIAKDGQTVATANLPMGTFKHTNVANASARNHYAAAGQVQDFSLQTLGSVAGTNTITGNLNPAITAYSAGMLITLIPVGNNTTAVTLATNGLSALDVQKADGDALVSGDLVADIPAVLVLDTGADDWILLNPQASVNGIATSDLARLSTTNTFIGGSNEIRSAGLGQIVLRDTAAAANEKPYAFRSISGQLNGHTLDDAGSASGTWLTVDRTGTTVDSINLQATAVQVNGQSVRDGALFTSIPTSGVLSYGTYTPTVTAGTNTSSMSAQLHKYTRIGAVVTVSGSASGTAGGAGALDFRITLPVASNFTTSFDALGAGASAQGGGAVTDGIAARVEANTAADNAVIKSVAVGAGAISFHYTFQYIIQ